MGSLDGLLIGLIRGELLPARDEVQDRVHPPTGRFGLLRLKHVQC